MQTTVINKLINCVDIDNNLATSSDRPLILLIAIATSIRPTRFWLARKSADNGLRRWTSAVGTHHHQLRAVAQCVRHLRHKLSRVRVIGRRLACSSRRSKQRPLSFHAAKKEKGRQPFLSVYFLCLPAVRTRMMERQGLTVGKELRQRVAGRQMLTNTRLHSPFNSRCADA